MTELSPIGTFCTLKRGMDEWDQDRQEATRAKQGWPMILTDLRIVGDDGQPLPHDAKAFGELQARGAHTIQTYHKVCILQQCTHGQQHSESPTVTLAVPAAPSVWPGVHHEPVTGRLHAPQPICAARSSTQQPSTRPVRTLPT